MRGERPLGPGPNWQAASGTSADGRLFARSRNALHT
ncbi:hypothetical protein STRAU_6015 [Streptomyces aurantiacus JA 4570]|uniref:Uncharacterized protein n=1 Tax=Streptomyces aurantiacus JA 4570 TaxID=1286094 RepID=S3ZE45_9ACTN|nr:hypothetical protein STRAU_6015 [Streptomyces aurantiacus JA 4570]